MDAGPKRVGYTDPDKRLLNDDWRKLLARAATYGNFSVVDFIRADPVERRVLTEVAVEVIEEGIQKDKLLANRIIYELSEALNRK